MAGAFLSDALRQQAMQEVRGQMLQDQIAKQVSRQIVGQIASQEIGQSMQRERGLGQALGQAAERQSRRDVGRSRLEMQKDLAERQKMMGLIGSAASAAGALGAHLALKKPSPEDAPMPRFDTPETQLSMGDFGGRFTEGQQAQLVPGVSDQLDTSVPQHFDVPLTAPETNLALSESFSAEPKQSESFKTPEPAPGDLEQRFVQGSSAPIVPKTDALVDPSMDPDPAHPLKSSPRMLLKHPVPMGRDYNMDSDMRLIEELRRKGML